MNHKLNTIYTSNFQKCSKYSKCYTKTKDNKRGEKTARNKKEGICKITCPTLKSAQAGGEVCSSSTPG